MLQLKRPLIFIDLETTGINIANDRIVEISMLKIIPNITEPQTLTMRLNPMMPIPLEASKVHGIYDADVANCPSFAKAATELFEFLENCDLAGFNSNFFDIPLLSQEFLRVNIAFKPEERLLIDVFKIFQKMERRDLQAAYRFYCQKELTNAHSAEADVTATYHIFLAQLQRYSSELQPTPEFLHEFCTEAKFYDAGRRMLVDEKGDIRFNFGKHKGKLVTDVLKQEPQYYDWILKSDFLLDTKEKLKIIKSKM